MKYIAVASGAYSDYRINLFLLVEDDFSLSAKVREFAAKAGLEWVEPKKKSGDNGFFRWPDLDGSYEEIAADRRRRMREAGCVFDDAMFKWTIEETDAFFLWLQQQPGVKTVTYEEQHVSEYGGLTP